MFSVIEYLLSKTLLWGWSMSCASCELCHLAAVASVPYFPAPERRRDLLHGLAALEWGSICSVGSRTRPRIRPGEGLNDVCSAWEHNASIV